MTPYISAEILRKYADEVIKECERIKNKEINFPIDVMDLFEAVFGLKTIFDDKSVLNDIEIGIFGALYPDGHISPFGIDKVIVINVTKPNLEERSPDLKKFIFWCELRQRSKDFTIAHEGGHYVCHYLKGLLGEQYRKPIYCREKERYSPLEFQANVFAGELLMPKDKVVWLLDGQKPPSVINIEISLLSKLAKCKFQL